MPLPPPTPNLTQGRHEQRRNFLLAQERLAWRVLPLMAGIILAASVAGIHWTYKGGHAKGKPLAHADAPQFEAYLTPPEIAPEQKENEPTEQIEEQPLPTVEPPPTKIIVEHKPLDAPHAIPLLAIIEHEGVHEPLLEMQAEIPPAPKENPRTQRAEQKRTRPKAIASASRAKAAQTSPSYRNAPRPPYPRSMRSRRISSSVGVRISINAEGKPTAVSIVSSSGYIEFDSSTRSWILAHWLFNPAKKGELAVPSSVTTRVNFVYS